MSSPPRRIFPNSSGLTTLPHPGNARRRARAYSWDDIGRRLLSIYELVTEESPTTLAAAG